METQRVSWRVVGLLTLLSVIHCTVASGDADEAVGRPEPPALTEGQTAGNWSLATPTGTTVSFYEDSNDKPSVIIFWATWCPACRMVMPELAKLQASLPEGSANFYALNIAEDGDPVAYFAEHEYKFRLLLGADDVAKEYGMFGTPRILVVDRHRVVRYTLKKGTSLEQLLIDLKEVVERSTS